MYQAGNTAVSKGQTSVEFMLLKTCKEDFYDIHVFMVN